MSEWSEEETEYAIHASMTLGHSASIIARHLRRFTRNAVISKLSRMGYKRQSAARPTVQEPYPKRKATIARRAAPAPLPKLEIPPPTVRTPSAPVLLEALRLGSCRYPVNNPPRGYGDLTLFCGAVTDEGSYCPDHARICLVPIPPRGAKSASELARGLRRTA
jgi:hypothetical protein